ncbi:hypothetical protein Rs2_15932 [Raphanus sativus]|nr:hypothetical protein Rs2_15932 [Raphanus sativus]
MVQCSTGLQPAEHCTKQRMSGEGGGSDLGDSSVEKEGGPVCEEGGEEVGKENRLVGDEPAGVPDVAVEKAAALGEPIQGVKLPQTKSTGGCLSGGEQGFAVEGKECDEGVDESGSPVVHTNAGGNKVDEVVCNAVTCLSDSSPCPASEKHQPVEAEAHLASLLLAKSSLGIDQIVPAVEDPDFGYFEQVLQSDPKVVHFGAGVYDLDNQFFLDLATPQKWVTTKHMEVLVEYVAKRHAEVLKSNRDLFVAPWFMDQLAGKVKTFKASTYKGRVFSDRKLAGYLTQPGQKLGVDVDDVYAPMFWGTNQWVGLRISINKWSVLVYDPDRSLRTAEEVRVLMTLVAMMLPYLVRKVCAAKHLGGRGLEPFGVELMADGYQNSRSGDCRPVAMKYIELAATGAESPDVEDLTDMAVDIFRKQYAMDVYKDLIIPLYMCV